MVKKEQALQALKSWGDQFRKRLKLRTAYLGDGRGNSRENLFVDENSDDYRRRQMVWARYTLDGAGAFAIFNKFVTPVIDLPVIIGEKDEDPNLEQVLGVDYNSLPIDNNKYNLPSHAPNHQLLGSDPLFIDSRQFVSSLVSPTSPSSMRLKFSGGVYQINGKWYASNSRTLPTLELLLPSAGTNRFVIVGIDPVSDTVFYYPGDEFTLFPGPGGGLVQNEIDNLPEIPPGVIPLAMVFLESTTSVVTWGEGVGNLFDYRQHIGADAGTELPARAGRVGEILYSIDGSSFAPALPIVNSDGLIVTNSDGLIVVAGAQSQTPTQTPSSDLGLGDTWQAVSTPDAGARSMPIELQDGRVVFVPSDISNSKSLILSSNGGINWERYFFPSNTLETDWEFMFQSSSGKIFLHYIENYATSADNMQTWSSSSMSTTPPESKCGVQLPSGRLVFAGYGEVGYSDDDGVTWAVSSLPGTIISPGISIMLRSQSGRIIISGMIDQSPKVFVSDDDGETWSSKVVPNTRSPESITQTQSGRIIIATPDPTSNSTGITFIFSDDDGDTWVTVETPIEGGAFLSVKTISTGRIISGRYANVPQSRSLIVSDNNGNDWSPVPNYADPQFFGWRYIIQISTGSVIAFADSTSPGTPSIMVSSV